MLRRSKIKARPVIKKTQTSSTALNPRSSSVQRARNTSEVAGNIGRPQNTVSCESSKAAAVDKTEDQPQLNELELQKSDAGDTIGCKDFENIQPSISASQVSSVEKPIQSNGVPADQSIDCQRSDSSKCSTAPKPQNGRRRKIVACPSTNSKRAKLSNVNVRSSLKTESLTPVKTPVSAPLENPSNIAACIGVSSHFPEEKKEQKEKLPPGTDMLISEAGSRTSESNTIVSQSSSQDDSHSQTDKLTQEKESKFGDSNCGKGLPHIGRRRKVIACPTIGRKKPKSDSQTSSAVTNSEKHPSRTVTTVAVADPISTDSLLMPGEVNEPALTSDYISLPPIQVAAVVEAVTDGLSEDVAVLTTVTNDGPNVFLPVVDSAKASYNDATQFVSANVGPMNIADASIDQTYSDGSAHQNLGLPSQGTEQSKKCANKSKSKSLSHQYRNKAMEKLKKLKRDQNDSSKWPELDQNYVSMSDLIFLNPPAEEGNKLGMNVENDEEQESIPVVQPANIEEPEKSIEEGQEGSSVLPTPQIRIAEDGTIVVDEESLVLDTQKPVDPTKRTVYESGRDSTLNQRSFMRRAFPKTLRWSIEDTKKFYDCLRIVGAEFSLMSAMFRTRSSDDLRRKFRRERKLNPSRVDEALIQQHLNKWSDDMFEMPQSQSALPVHSPQQAVK